MHGIRWSIQLREYARFRQAIGVSPAEFYRYRLWDETRPRTERVKILSWRDRRRLEEFFNQRSDVDLVRSKVQSDALCRTHDLPTPARLALWSASGECGDGEGPVVSTVAGLAALIGQHPHGLVCKREYGGSGDHVLVFVAADGAGLTRPDGSRWSVSQLAARMAGSDTWLLQERVLPHPELVALSGSAGGLATVRIVTCLRATGDVLVLPATLKLPDQRSGLDNFGAGNPAVAVSDRGVLGAACHGIDGPIIDRHPITGRAFRGIVLPDWDAAVALCRRGQQLLPTLRSIGWDIALTTTGPKSPCTRPVGPAAWVARSPQQGLTSITTGPSWVTPMS
ncbi:MAG: hypothetical protein LC667_09580 [Thioalkalivibrio sp.]|nr:hypothetical protein [Thioalkalivibrio sp.]